jgi:tetratricopeptide (TPR) repeat protein
VPILEREDSLSRLRRAYDRAAGESGSIFLITGEAGVGKTALVQHFCEQVPEEARVCRGACDDLMTPSAFGPWHDIAREGDPPLTDALADADPASVLQAIVGLAADEDGATVLVIEDVQWADDATLDSLRYLSRRIASLRMMVVLTYRPEDLTADHPLVGLLGLLHGDAFDRVDLEPLSEAGVRDLVSDSGVDAAELHRVTGGNPFFVREVLASPGDVVPATVRAAVVSRLQHLSREARSLIAVLSVAPGGIEHELVAELSEGALSAVSEAEEHRFLDGDERRIRFHNELARRAVEESMTEAARRQVHQRMLEMLRLVDADGARLLHHAVAAGDVDVLLEYAPREAQRSAASGAHRQAAAWYEALLDHESRLGATDHAQTLHDYAVELHRLHRLEDAARVAAEAVAAWEGLDDATGLGRAIIELARDQYFIGDTEAAHDSTTRAIAVLEEGGNDEALAAAYSSLAALYVWRHRMVDALPWGERAARLARSIDRPDILSHALNYLGVAKVLTGDETGFDDLAESVATARRIGHAEFHTRGANNLATAYFSRMRYAEGIDALRAGVAVATEAELVSQEYNMRGLLGQGLLMLGRWDEAERELRPIIEEASDDLLVAPSFGYLGRLLMRRGAAEGDELIDRGLSITGVDESLLRYGALAVAAIERAWLAGDLPTVERIYTKVTTMAAAVESQDWTGTVSVYAARAGLDVTPPDPCPPSFLYSILGDWEQAAAAWGEVGDPYERAVELVLSGREDLGLEGIRTLEELGARRTVEWARAHPKI